MARAFSAMRYEDSVRYVYTTRQTDLSRPRLNVINGILWDPLSESGFAKNTMTIPDACDTRSCYRRRPSRRFSRQVGSEANHSYEKRTYVEPSSVEILLELTEVGAVKYQEGQEKTVNSYIIYILGEQDS